MSGATKTMAATTGAALLLTTAYTVALGSSGWLWFCLILLVVVTIGMAAADDSAPASSPRPRTPGGPGTSRP
ncbi:hypothetical protein [Streptomyces sp. NPDC056144]|uniref:hypothetical protein n=1 Tax=unclassified Streptomyces TaxID=2593676 RepID=UPI0035D891ED